MDLRRRERVTRTGAEYLRQREQFDYALLRMSSDTASSRHAQQMSTMLALWLHPRSAEELMSPKRIVGLVLVAIGMVILLWGGVFWTDRDTIVDAGPLEIQTEDREGVALPPIIGALALVGGVILVLIPSRRRI